MNIPFFTDYLMLSNPLSIGIIAVFVLALIGIYVLQRKGTSFGNLVIIGTIVGAILGIAVQIIAGFPDDPSKVVYIKESTKWFSLVGGGFIDLIRMLVIPIVFISIVHVILHMEAGANLKKLVVAMVSTNLGMVAVAAIVGLILGNAFGLGQGFDVVESGKKIREIKPMVDTFRALIPSNPIQAAAETNVIGIVVFAIILGSVARLLKQTGTNSMEIFTKLFDELHQLISWVADFIIGLMPYGVVALLASTLATRGLQAILDMGLFVVLLYVGLLIMFVVQAILIASFGYNPITYFKKSKSSAFVSFYIPFLYGRITIDCGNFDKTSWRKCNNSKYSSILRYYCRHARLCRRISSTCRCIYLQCSKYSVRFDYVYHECYRYRYRFRWYRWCSWYSYNGCIRIP